MLFFGAMTPDNWLQWTALRAAAEPEGQPPVRTP